MSGTDLSNEIFLVLRVIIRAVDLHSRYLTQHYGLTGPQLVVLRELARQGRIPVGRLARAVSLSHATVTGIVERLEKRGLVEKHPDTSDRRKVLVGTTQQGEGFASGAPLLQQSFAAELARLQPWEQTWMLSCLQRIGSMMQIQELDDQDRDAGWSGRHRADGGLP